MVERAYLVLEMLAGVLCLYGLFGKKFKWNIYTVLYLSIDFICYQIEYIYGGILGWELVLYAVFLLYVRVQFKGVWKTSIINYILCIILCSVVQLVSYYPIFYLLNIKMYPATYFSVNLFLLFLIYVLYKRKVLSKLSLYMQQKGRMVFLMLFILVSFLIFAMYSIGVTQKLEALEYYLLIGSMMLLFLLLYYLQKERLVNQQFMVEKNLNSLYGNALSELIEKVRINQHNYKNQLTTIQGMVYTAQSIEELRIAQEKYYQIIEREDKYYKIISGNNDPVIAGFLYSKLCNVEMENIQIDCSLKVNKIENILLTSDVIKVLGILIDNAFEEIRKEKYKKKGINIKLNEIENIVIEVGNVCQLMSTSEIETCFKKGHSSKGENRGLGLYNVSEIVHRWKGEILPENREQNGENWFYIKVEFPKEKRP